MTVKMTEDENNRKARIVGMRTAVTYEIIDALMDEMDLHYTTRVEIFARVHEILEQYVIEPVPRTPVLPAGESTGGAK